MNKVTKNLERIKTELKALREEYTFIASRFRYVTLPGMKSRVPQGKRGMGYPDNNELFHLLVACIEEFYDKAPRVAAYRDIIVAAAVAAYLLIGVFL
jgi:hypothetical protein